MLDKKGYITCDFMDRELLEFFDVSPLIKIENIEFNSIKELFSFYIENLSSNIIIDRIMYDTVNTLILFDFKNASNNRYYEANYYTEIMIMKTEEDELLKYYKILKRNYNIGKLLEI